ncbi:hypothetical protein EV368DRAFT_20286, partial [Lentinula lateritia]
HPTAHLIFIVSASLCLYNFWRAVCLDPGFVPNRLLDSVETLASEGRLNGQTFCVSCMVFGANNHRQFVLFLLNLVIGIITFIYLTYQCKYLFNLGARFTLIYLYPLDFSTTPELAASPTCPLPEPMCRVLATKSNIFLVTTTLWAAIQLTWTTILLGAQFWQVSRQMTSLEVSNLGRYGFMGGRGVIGVGQMG